MGACAARRFDESLSGSSLIQFWRGHDPRDLRTPKSLDISYDTTIRQIRV